MRNTSYYKYRSNCPEFGKEGGREGIQPSPNLGSQRHPPREGNQASFLPRDPLVKLPSRRSLCLNHRHGSYLSANGRRSTHASGRLSKEAGLRIASSIREVLMPVLLHRSSPWTRERTRQSSSVDRPTRDRSEVGLRSLFITRCSTY
jgi:hypothetical protein